MSDPVVEPLEGVNKTKVGGMNFIMTDEVVHGGAGVKEEKRTRGL
jgi:hypothetical protein